MSPLSSSSAATSIPRQWLGPLSRAKKLTATQAAAAGAPPSVNSIPTTVRYGPIPLYRHYDPTSSSEPAASVAIRDLGPSRRIFLLQSNLTAEEMNGLAYRIRNLSKNQSINSMLLSNSPPLSTNPTSNNNVDPDRILPTYVWEQDLRQPMNVFHDTTSPKKIQEIWHVCGGYNPQSLLHSSLQEKQETLAALQNVALACWGGSSTSTTKITSGDPFISSHRSSCIPFISVPHGLVSDGGYAIAMGTYVLATQDTSFVIHNPRRGLALDPIGLSFTLPRLGQEFRQPSANYPVGMILALTGYEADAADMVETGLATHYIENFRQIASLERILMELPSWEQQKLMKPEKTFYTGKSSSLGIENTQTTSTGDINAKYRNVAIAHYIHALSVYDAAGQEFSTTPTEDETEFWCEEDPSLVLEQDRGRGYGDRDSLLVNIAATFTFFESEKSVAGIMERLKAIKSRSTETHDEEEKEASDIARRLLRNMESASPLALLAVHRLMELGKGKMESLEQCMEREARVQLKLMMHSDFQNWAKSGLSEGVFKGWRHKKVKDVTADEVEELFQE